MLIMITEDMVYLMVSEDVSVSYGIGSMEFENTSLEDQGQQLVYLTLMDQ